MPAYIRNKIDNVVTVRSIVTVLHLDLRNALVRGESHDFPEIFYVEQGLSTLTIDGKPMLLDAGSMVIYGPNSFHGDVVPKCPGGIVDIISFDADSVALDSLYNRPIKLNARQREQFETLIARGQALFNAAEPTAVSKGMALTERADPRELQQLKNLLELFLLDVSLHLDKCLDRSPNANQERLYRQQMETLTTYLMENLNQKLSLKQLEAALGLSESSLRRLVRRYRGCGPLAYFQELKIREAKQLIRNSSLNMTEISEQLGFSSLHYFSRMFREKTGSSPTDYAKSVK